MLRGKPHRPLFFIKTTPNSVGVWLNPPATPLDGDPGRGLIRRRLGKCRKRSRGPLGIHSHTRRSWRRPTEGRDKNRCNLYRRSGNRGMLPGCSKGLIHRRRYRKRRSCANLNSRWCMFRCNRRPTWGNKHRIHRFHRVDWCCRCRRGRPPRIGSAASWWNTTGRRRCTDRAEQPRQSPPPEN